MIYHNAFGVISYKYDSWVYLSQYRRLKGTFKKIKAYSTGTIHSAFIVADMAKSLFSPILHELGPPSMCRLTRKCHTYLYLCMTATSINYCQPNLSTVSLPVIMATLVKNEGILSTEKLDGF